MGSSELSAAVDGPALRNNWRQEKGEFKDSRSFRFCSASYEARWGILHNNIII